MRQGLWIPRGLQQRYPLEQQPVGGALFEAYITHMGGVGDTVVVPVAELLENVGYADTFERRAEITRVLLAICRTQRVGYRIDQGVVTLWLTPEMQARVKTYQELPDGILKP